MKPLRVLPLLLVLPMLVPAQTHKLLVISIDGLDVRFLKDADRLRLKIPNLRKLMAGGALSEGVVGVVPTVTWPSHTTLITGVKPEQHGIVSNDQPGKPSQRWWFTSFLKSRTLWEVAEAKKLKTATVYWPVTVGAKVDFNCPEFWETRSEHEILFDPISRKCTPGLVDRIASVFPAFTKSRWDDQTALEAVEYLLEFEQPDLTLVHIADLDAEQHETGALSIYARDLLETDDERIGAVLRKLPPHTVVAIVSDHGFETADFIVRPRVMVKGEVQVREGLIGTKDANAIAYFRKALANPKLGIAREVPMQEVRLLAPALKNWTAAFETVHGYVPSADIRGPAVGAGTHTGVHGLWPTRLNYRSSFLLWGEDVRAVRIPEISMLDIAPTFADILKVKLPAAKQPSLWPRLRK